MADVERQVKIAFEGDDRISGVIDGINGKLDSFASSVRGVTTPMAELASGVLKTEAAFAALAAGALVVAFNESKKFESATIELQKVLGDEVGVLDQARQNAVELSDTYGESSSSVLRSTANFKQAGFDINESFTLTKAAMDLVIAGSIDSAEASNYLISILKGFKAPGEEATRIIDILNEVSNNYATDVRQLAIGMADLSPVAKLMGFQFEETAGILTPVIEVFRDGSESANALKTGLLKLVDDRGPVVEALKAIGVSQFDLNGNMRSGKDILLDVSKAFVGLSDEQKIFFAQQLAGIEQGARMVEVFNGLAKSQEVTAVAMGAAGSAAKEVEIRLLSAEVAVNRFITGAQNLAVAVGDQFRLAAKEAIDGGTSIEIALRKMVDSGTFAPVLDLISEFGRDLGADLRQIAQIMPEAFAGVDWSRLTDSLRNLGGEVVDLFEAAFGDVDLTTVEGLQSAVQKVVDGVAALTNVTAGILDSWEPFVRALAAAAEQFSEADASTQGLTGNILGFGQAIDSVLSHVGAVTGAINLLGGAIGLLGVTQIPGAIAAFQALGLAGGAVASVLSGVGVAAAAVGVSIALDSVLGAVLPKWDEHRQALADNIGALHGADFGLDEIESSLESAGQAAIEQKDIWQELTEAIGAMPENVTTEVEAKGVQLTKEEIDGIVQAFGEIGEKKTVEVTAEANETEIARVKDIIITELPDGVVVLTKTSIDQAALDKTKSALDSALPEKRAVEIKLQGAIDIELAKIETQAKTVQTAMEWKAKVDIAEVEAIFKSLETQSTNIKDMFTDTGDVLQSLAASFADVGGLARLDLFELMEEESRRRDQLLIEQSKLTDAQIRYLDARAKAMQQGQGIITINAEGIQPELELVLQRIIELAQIRANEEGLNFLLGVT